MDDRARSEWRWAARTLGLTAVPRRNAYRGIVGGFPFDLDHEGGGTRLTLRARLPPRFALAHETLRSRLGGMLGAGDLVTGDDAFDAEIRVAFAPGDLTARAVLGSGARAEIRRLMGKGVTVGGDTLEYVTPEVIADSEALVGLARDLALLASLLSLSRHEIAQRLFENTYDPEPCVRRRALEALVEAFPDSDECARAAKGALSDSDVAMRREGAFLRQSGARGIDVLLEMAVDSTLRFEDRAAAFEGFLARASPVRVVEELAELASKGGGTLVSRLLVRVLADAKEDARPSLERLAADPALPADLRAAAANALARITGRGSAGRVSLADGGRAGALSEPAERGAVSVVPAPAKPRKKR